MVAETTWAFALGEHPSNQTLLFQFRVLLLTNFPLLIFCRPGLLSVFFFSGEDWFGLFQAAQCGRAPKMTDFLGDDGQPRTKVNDRKATQVVLQILRTRRSPEPETIRSMCGYLRKCNLEIAVKFLEKVTGETFELRESEQETTFTHAEKLTHPVEENNSPLQEEANAERSELNRGGGELAAAGASLPGPLERARRERASSGTTALPSQGDSPAGGCAQASPNIHAAEHEHMDAATLAVFTERHTSRGEVSASARQLYRQERPRDRVEPPSQEIERQLHEDASPPKDVKDDALVVSLPPAAGPTEVRRVSERAASSSLAPSLTPVVAQQEGGEHRDAATPAVFTGPISGPARQLYDDGHPRLQVQPSEELERQLREGASPPKDDLKDDALRVALPPDGEELADAQRVSERAASSSLERPVVARGDERNSDTHESRV